MSDPAKSLEEDLDENKIKREIRLVSKTVFGFEVAPEEELSRQLSPEDKQTLIDKTCERYYITEYNPDPTEIRTVDDLARYVREYEKTDTEIANELGTEERMITKYGW